MMPGAEMRVSVWILIASLLALVPARGAGAEVVITCPGKKPETFEYVWQAECVQTCPDGSWRIKTEEDPEPCLRVRPKRREDAAADATDTDMKSLG